ncbi:hypothetical protein CPLU01_04849 [Colletotrichum plurivorum]|uniref:Uncharacterized protein n=1 Tax=Colletotrichum plurivorum TaxID=2175906 RepID=A0A8H6KN04_9PEZI|nr:hypothetical protein CPLU01_04849 [Colletotrichum plurivorum]
MVLEIIPSPGLETLVAHVLDSRNAAVHRYGAQWSVAGGEAPGLVALEVLRVFSRWIAIQGGRRPSTRDGRILAGLEGVREGGVLSLALLPDAGDKDDDNGNDHPVRGLDRVTSLWCETVRSHIVVSSAQLSELGMEVADRGDENLEMEP